MSAPDTESPKSRQTFMILVFIALAAWGGWGLAKMGEHRSRAKAEAESSRITGVGEVREREEKDIVPAGLRDAGPVKAPPAEAAKADGSPGLPVQPVPVPEPAKEVAKEVEPVPEVTPPAPVGPPVLIVRTVPLAEVWVADVAGLRPVGLADASGAFTIGTLPAGEFSVEVRHADYRPLSSPLAVTLKAGETVERLIMPESKPGSLILLTDEGAVAYLDGRKVGGYAVMLGSVPSRRELSLILTLADGTTTHEETLTLAPRENRLLDRRSPAKAKAEPVAVGATGSVAPAKVAVRVISAAVDTGLIAFSSEGGGAAPLAVGATGRLLIAGAGEPVGLSCVRTFGGVSVCKAGKLPAIETPVSGELTK